MKIRTKLFLLLLFISVLPILVLRGLGQSSLTLLGQELAGQGAALAAEETRELMLVIAEDHARILSRDRLILEQAVSGLARRIEEVLSDPKPKIGPIYFDTDFDASNPAIPGLGEYEGYLAAHRGGQEAPLAVSFAHQVLRLPPGSTLSRLGLDRLSGLDAIYRRLRERYGTRVHWQMTAFNDGLLSSFPGHGSFPRGLDPRLSPWYLNALASGRITWTTLSLDPATKLPHLTVSVPFNGPDGKVAGVCAILTRMEGALQQNEHARKISSSLTTFLVMASKRSNGTPGLEILASEDPTVLLSPGRRMGMGMGMGGFRAPLEPSWLESRDPEKLAKMREDIEVGRTGSQIMEYLGREYLFAYAGSAEPGAALVMLAPLSDVSAKAEAVSASVQHSVREMQRLTGLVLAGALALIVLLAFVVARLVSKPLSELSDAARRIASGDLEAKVKPRGKDELGELCESFNEMIPKLRQNVRLREAISLASEIQRDLLPAAPPALEGFDIAAVALYCDETGGDYFDFLELSPDKADKLGIVLADVSGHGLGAALLMTTARAFLRQRAAQSGNCQEIINEVNRNLCADTQGSGRFMTLFYLELNQLAASLEWVRAGHDPAMLYSPQLDKFRELGGPGIPLGVMEDYAYSSRASDELKPGEFLLLGSDGIWETSNPDRELFGKERTQVYLRANQAEPAERIVRGLCERLAEFRGKAAVEDDITIIVVKRLP